MKDWYIIEHSALEITVGAAFDLSSREIMKLWLMVLLVLCVAVSAVMGQLQTFTFSASRPDTDIDFSMNLLTLRCEDENGAINDPVFFRDGRAINVQALPGGMEFLYTISRSLEGHYGCGTEASGVSSNTLLLVGELGVVGKRREGRGGEGTRGGSL